MIDIDSKDFHKNSNRFSFECSDKDCFGGKGTKILRNPKTGQKMEFNWFKTDQDEDGDIYGWHYRSKDGKYTLLIIND